ncbi:MAG: class I SAM-dependent methyltransferase [Vicinamibacteria bacterium]
MDHRAEIARGFDRLAPVYDLLGDVAFLGRIRASQVALLPRLPPIQSALVLGGGTGRFLETLLRNNVARTAVSIDLSSGMTRETAARLTRSELSTRADLRIGSLEHIRDGETFDLIATHCFLDLFDDGELRAIVGRLDAALNPGGLWLFSDFCIGRGVARQAIVTTLYAFFGWTCSLRTRGLPNFDAAFRGIGLDELARERFALGLLEARLLRKPASKQGL